MERPIKDNDDYWLPTIQGDGIKSTPFNHVRYEQELELYCKYIQKQLVDMTQYRDGLSQLYIDTMNDLALEHIHKTELMDMIQKLIDSSVTYMPSPITDRRKEIPMYMIHEAEMLLSKNRENDYKKIK